MPKGVYTDGKAQLTVRLDPALIKRAKLRAIERDMTVQDLVERALEQSLKTPR